MFLTPYASHGGRTVAPRERRKKRGVIESVCHGRFLINPKTDEPIPDYIVARAIRVLRQAPLLTLPGRSASMKLMSVIVLNIQEGRERK
jgi:hypothetical protein